MLLRGPKTFVFIDDFPDVLGSADPFLFADDMKLWRTLFYSQTTLSYGRNNPEMQDDLHSAELAVEKYSKISKTLTILLKGSGDFRCGLLPRSSNVSIR